MRLYIAGPMTGLPEFNYPAFAAAEAQLLASGFLVESPHHNGADGEQHDWQWYMRTGLTQMLRCDGVALLDGWYRSKGAKLEMQVADEIGMSVQRIEDWLSTAHEAALKEGSVCQRCHEPRRSSLRGLCEGCENDVTLEGGCNS